MARLTAHDVVVVGSGPGGLQVAYFLAQLGVRHVVVSADDAPGGMFRRWPVFERLLSWTQLDAPVPRDSRAYEWHDHNSLLAEEPDHRALVAAEMGREAIVPARQEMERGLAAFASRVPVAVRYGCRWESTRRDGDEIVLGTTQGELRCRFAVFAPGVTTPWRSPIAGVEHVPHYADTRPPETYRGRDVVVLGKRNSAFELADGLLPWARRVVLVSPRPAQTAVLAHATVRVRYFQPLEVHAAGGATFVLDAAPTRIERVGERWRVDADGTTRPGRLVLEADDVIAATGFATPLGDLPALGVETVAAGRIPALTPWWESADAAGIFFAGNASQGAPGLRKHGLASTSTAVQGFRYNARLLALHLAERLGVPQPQAPHVAREDVPAVLTRALRAAPELWAQKGYLARALSLADDGWRDGGVVPLAHFVDSPGPDALAVTIEVDGAGTISPCVYVRRHGGVAERQLDPDLLRRFDGAAYADTLNVLAEAV